jgi:hypothetical protein
LLSVIFIFTRTLDLVIGDGSRNRVLSTVATTNVLSSPTSAVIRQLNVMVSPAGPPVLKDRSISRRQPTRAHTHRRTYDVGSLFVLRRINDYVAAGASPRNYLHFSPTEIYRPGPRTYTMIDDLVR